MRKETIFWKLIASHLNLSFFHTFDPAVKWWENSQKKLPISFARYGKLKKWIRILKTLQQFSPNTNTVTVVETSINHLRRLLGLSVLTRSDLMKKYFILIKIDSLTFRFGHSFYEHSFILWAVKNVRNLTFLRHLSH
jgi:hypothetical protein